MEGKSILKENKEEVREIKVESEKELPKVTAQLSIEKIENGYADCNVRLISAEHKEKQRPAEQH